MLFQPSLFGAALLVTAGSAVAQSTVGAVNFSPLHQETILVDARPGTTEAAFAAIRSGSGTTTLPTVTVPDLALTSSYLAAEFDTALGDATLMELQSDRYGHGLFFNHTQNGGLSSRAIALKVDAHSLSPAWYNEYSVPGKTSLEFDRVIQSESPSDPAFIALATLNEGLTAVIKIGEDGTVHWARTYDFESEQLAALDLVLHSPTVAAIVCAQKDASVANPAIVLQMINLHNGNTQGRPRRFPEFATTAVFGGGNALGMAFAPSFGVAGATEELYIARNSALSGNIVVAAINENGVPGTTIQIANTAALTPNSMAFAGDGRLLISVTGPDGTPLFVHLNEVDLVTGFSFATIRDVSNSAAYSGLTIDNVVPTIGSPIAVAHAEATNPADAAIWFDDFFMGNSCFRPGANPRVEPRTRLTWQILPRVTNAPSPVTLEPLLVSAVPATAPVSFLCQ